MSIIGRINKYLIRNINIYLGKRRAKHLGISFSPPNYLYLQRLNSNSIVVDVGCADDPDFSIHVIDKYNCKSYGVDPTRKHFEALKEVETNYKDKFFHLPFAVADKSGKLVFHESKTNTSGSVLEDHINIKYDQITSYEVLAISIMDLKQRIVGGGKIDYLKLDLEGAEYRILEKARPNEFDNIDQLFIEFHHHCIDSYSLNDTNNLVQKIKNFGFNVFSIDQHNYLFFR